MGWLLGIVVALAACWPDRGSEQDLAAQFRRLPISTDARQVGESYAECPADADEYRAVCPTLHRWYEIEGETDRVRNDVEALTEEGFHVDAQDRDAIAVTDGDYYFFLTFGVGAREGDEAPKSADLKVEAAPVPDF